MLLILHTGFVDNEQKAPEDSEFDYREMILRDYNKFITADANGKISKHLSTLML